MRKTATRSAPRYRDVIRAIAALALAAAFIKTGASKLPISTNFANTITTTLGTPSTPYEAAAPGAATRRFFSERGWQLQAPPPSAPSRDSILRHPPVFVYSEPMLAPLIVRAKAIKQLIKRERGRFDRAPFNEKIRVSLTQYCLQGTTRRSNAVRLGIVAADPRVFPLAHYVEVFLGSHHLGKFLVDDTGGNVKGPTLDIWNPSCSEARRFGRQWGSARLVVK